MKKRNGAAVQDEAAQEQALTLQELRAMKTTLDQMATVMQADTHTATVKKDIQDAVENIAAEMHVQYSETSNAHVTKVALEVAEKMQGKIDAAIQGATKDTNAKIEALTQQLAQLTTAVEAKIPNQQINTSIENVTQQLQNLTTAVETNDRSIRGVGENTRQGITNLKDNSRALAEFLNKKL